MKIAEDFDKKWNIPHCIGAIDGKHVVMDAPPHSGSLYYNYKGLKYSLCHEFKYIISYFHVFLNLLQGTHSVVLMGIADAQYKFIYIDVGANGRSSDGGVFKRTSFFKAMENNELSLPQAEPLQARDKPIPYFLVADDAFALSNNVQKPFAQTNLTGLQRVFNYRISRARRIIENAFGILSCRFRVFRKAIHLIPSKVKSIVLASCALHNYLMTRSNTYNYPALVDRYDNDGKLISGDWRREEGSESSLFSLEVNRQFKTNKGKEIQEELMQYFVHEGEIPFQYASI